MPKEITAAMVQKSVKELAGFVSSLAKEVYKEDYPEEDEAEYGADMDAAAHGSMHNKNDDGLGDEDMMPYDDESEDMYMARMKKASVKKFRTKKGFANSAQDASSEEDAKWDEKDSTFDGNEASPAGDQAGTEDDETFGPGGMAYSAMVKQIAEISKVVSGISQHVGGEQVVLSKGVVPGMDGQDHRVGGGAGAGGGMAVTREMQEQTKARSWKDINRLRMDVGDLPRNVF